jgi:hypothetical protein
MEHHGRNHPTDVVAPEGTPDVGGVLATAKRGETSQPSTSGPTEPTTILRQIVERLEVLEESMDTRIGRLEQTVARNHEEDGHAIARVNERVRRSRQTKTPLYNDTRRTSGVPGMPNLMPSEVKPAKMDKIASTNTDDTRSLFRHARGYINVSPDEERSVFWAAGFFEGPLSKWWHQRCTMT